jgi:hypothetical protein
VLHLLPSMSPIKSASRMTSCDPTVDGAERSLICLHRSATSCGSRLASLLGPADLLFDWKVHNVGSNRCRVQARGRRS